MNNTRTVSVLAVFGLLASTNFACTRSSTPSRAAVAVPVTTVVPAPAPVQSEPAANEPESLGDEQFRPASSSSNASRSTGNTRTTVSLALPVVSRLTSPNGETRIRLVGVVGPNALGNLLNRHGELQATILQIDGVEILAVDQNSLTISDLDAKDVLDARDILRRSGAGVMHPTPLGVPAHGAAEPPARHLTLPPATGAELQHPTPHASSPQ